MNDSDFADPLKILALVGLVVSLGPVNLRAQQSSPSAAADGSILPFPPVPSASVAGPTLQESTMKWRKEPERLKPGAPNVLIVLIDDVGFGVPDTFGGEVHTPTLTRLRDAGISYNAFHTTSICSPSRAALLTGRNHHRVGNGTIAERASDFDGYTGIIPKTSATLPEVLHHYGYKSAAFGKWHNTPANQTTAMGPFDRWPTGHGFDYFYGFLAGETSQWEPRLYENLNAIEPPHSEKYHLTEDMVDKGLAWIKRHQAFSPDKPFLMYWAPGGAHGPHHIFPEWADKYKGKFDDGWDKYRERVFQRQKELGWIPARCEADAATRHDGVVGQHSRSGAAIPAAAHGGVRRFRRAHRCAGGQARGRARTTRCPRQHHHPLHLGRQRLERRGPEGKHQRTARPEQHPEHDRTADGRTRRTSAGCRPWAGPRSTTCTTPAGRGPAARHSGPPSSSPRTSAAPATRWSSPGRRGSSRTRRRGRSSTTSTTSCRRSTK